MIIGDGIVLGAGGESASIFVTGLSETDTVTASKDGKTVIGKWTQKPNPAYVVPDGYTQLEYIESTGTQYIDLNIVPTNHTFEIQYDSGAYNNDEKLFGTEAGYQYYAFTLYSNKYYWGLNGSQTCGGTWSAGKKTLLYNSGSNYGVIQDGVTLGSGSKIAANGQSLCLFKRVTTEGVFFQGLTYYCKLTEKSTNNVVRDCIPCKRLSDNAVGLYDKVEQKFYANAGTGTFTEGPEVPQTIDGFLIDKIKSYGTWTVTATDGTKTATHDVLVDAADMFSVSINYSPSNALYWNGDPCENATGGWTNDDYTFTTWGSSYTRFQVTQTDEYMDSSATEGYTLAGTFNAIDLTNYSKVMWEIDNVTGIAGGGYPPSWRLCASPTKSFSTSTETVTEVQVTATGIHTYSIDVSSLSGLYFISFTNNSIAYSGRQLIGHILRVWLE